VSDAEATGGSVKNLGWRVTFAGLGINLALGILYTWSVISKGVPDEWKWLETDKSWPYAIACLVFAFVMVPAGRMQDKISPRLTAAVGGVLVGVGMLVAGLSEGLTGWIVGIGVLAGAGIGFGYAACTPPAVKWFPKAKTGLIAGLVVSGFGLASVYAGPLTNYLIETRGFNQAIMILAACFFLIVVGLAQFLKAPPAGYVPEGQVPVSPATAGVAVKKEDFKPSEMLKTWQFYLLWFLFFCGAGAGLMIIAKLSPIMLEQASIKKGFLLVAVFALGNGGGRILAGMLSDKIGRKLTLAGFLFLQAIMFVLLWKLEKNSVLGSVASLSAMCLVMGACYGANLAVFPSITKDFYGLKSFGMNYGLVFTAWGIGGFALAMLAGKLRDKFGDYSYAYFTAIGLLVLAAVLTFAIKPPHHVVEEAEQVPEPARKPRSELEPVGVGEGR
jgi:MFS transporter, OFA family, oxalate/formate antiporter